MSTETKPRVLIVYFSLTQQSARVAEAMAQALAARGCDVTKASLEFTDERWVPKLSRFPMNHPFPQVRSAFHRRRRKATTTWCYSPLLPGGSRRACPCAPTSSRRPRRR